MADGEPVGWLRAIVVDAEDHEALAQFWAEVLGVGIAVREQDWVQLDPGRGGSFLAFQPPLPDSGPGQGMRLRPDIEVTDIDVGRARVEELGGTFVRPIHEIQGGDTHYVMADPEGNEFCLVNPLPPELARRWPGVDP